MSWTDPAGHIFVTGELMTAANFKTYVTDDLSALRAGISCGAYKTSQPVINSNVWTGLSFEGNNWDNGPIHNLGGALDHFVAPVAGAYVVTASQLYANPGFPFNTNQGIRILLNGTTVIEENFTALFGGIDWPCQVHKSWKAAAGDYFTVESLQGNGGTLTLLAATAAAHFIGTG